MTDERKVTIPPRFWHDHALRADDWPGTVVRESTRGVVVLLTAEQEADLAADARFYAESDPGWFGPAARGLVASARATLRALA